MAASDASAGGESARPVPSPADEQPSPTPPVIPVPSDEAGLARRPDTAVSRFVRARSETGPRPGAQPEGNERVRLVQANSRNLVAASFGPAFLTAATTFNAVYAVRLGASNAEIGLLSAAPCLVQVLLAIPVASHLQRLPDLVRFVVTRGILSNRLIYLSLVVVPLVPPEFRAPLLVALLVATAIPSTVTAVGLNAVIADAVPNDRRALVISRRAIVSSVTTLAVVTIAGRWLDSTAFPTNYQILYLIAGAFGLTSVWFYARVRLAGAPSRQGAGAVAPRLMNPLAMLRAARGQTGFVRLTLDTLLFSAGTWLAGPLYALLYIRELGATDGFFGILAAIGCASGAVAYYLWQRGIARWGDSRVLIATVIASGVVPVIVGLSPSLAFIPIASLVAGLTNPGVAISQSTTLLRVCPEGQRPTFLAIWTVVMNVGAFIAPMLSVAAAGAVGYRPVLIFAGLLWMFGGLAFWRFPPEPAAATEAGATAALCPQQS
jgi:hypothetical protein